MSREKLSVRQKALEINLDPTKYGTFAEIGAGQEVVRWFFQAGGAAGTVAKSMSAYDMVFSDAIYGREPHGRYVSEDRLRQMLDHEYNLISERLWSVRPENTSLFVFADTIAAKSYNKNNECHGWLGFRYQTHPTGQPNDVVIHIRLLDSTYLQQQEVVGSVGVNLIYAAFYYLNQPEVFIESLLDNIEKHRIEIDMIEFSGPAYAHIDNRLISLELVKQELTQAILFDTTGRLKQPSDVLHRKPVLIQRGAFRPVTHVNMDMQQCAISNFLREPDVKGKTPMVLMEISLSNLSTDGEISNSDYLDRIDLLCSLGNTVLISNFAAHYEFASFIARTAKDVFALVLKLANLRETMNETYYQNLDGGILEAFGKLFTRGGKLYIYPEYDPASNTLLTAQSLTVAPHLNYLYRYLLDNNFIVDLLSCDVTKIQKTSSRVLQMIQQNETGWEDFVPEKVVNVIKTKKLWQSR